MQGCRIWHLGRWGGCPSGACSLGQAFRRRIFPSAKLLRQLPTGQPPALVRKPPRRRSARPAPSSSRSEEHTSELQSLMRISYAVFCLKNKNKTIQERTTTKK